MDYEEEDGERMERAKSPVEELAPTSIPNADLPTEQDVSFGRYTDSKGVPEPSPVSRSTTCSFILPNYRNT